ncbi:MAG TPA: hypothetical protein VN961_18105 [Streptosporangiaceae bacterium]|nr:hypothetical protein [Streptosporangiaceae bacterium]
MDVNAWQVLPAELGEHCGIETGEDYWGDKDVCGRRATRTVQATLPDTGEDFGVPLCAQHASASDDLCKRQAEPIVRAAQAQRQADQPTHAGAGRPAGGRPGAPPGKYQRLPATGAARLPATRPGSARPAGTHPPGRDMRDLTGKPHK